VSEREDYTGGAPESGHHADPAEKTKDLAGGAAHGVAHPLETTKGLGQEAGAGESPRTPLIALTGVTIGVGVVVVLILAIALTLYFVLGGR
jgi:hypothetical protein